MFYPSEIKLDKRVVLKLRAASCTVLYFYLSTHLPLAALHPQYLFSNTVCLLNTVTALTPPAYKHIGP